MYIFARNSACTVADIAATKAPDFPQTRSQCCGRLIRRVRSVRGRHRMGIVPAGFKLECGIVVTNLRVGDLGLFGKPKVARKTPEREMASGARRGQFWTVSNSNARPTSLRGSSLGAFADTVPSLSRDLHRTKRTEFLSP